MPTDVCVEEKKMGNVDKRIINKEMSSRYCYCCQKCSLQSSSELPCVLFKVQALEAEYLGSNPWSATYSLCDFGQVRNLSVPHFSPR